MEAKRRTLKTVRGSVAFVFALCLALVFPLNFQSHVHVFQAQAQANEASIRLVHGLAGVGPLDIYIDGSLALIGMAFGETSGPITLTAGDRDFAVVPTGETLDAAFVNGPITLRDGADYYTVLLGMSESVSVGLFAIDGRGLDQGRARFRIISGVPDGSGIVPTFEGGEALTEPLGFGDASQYASVDAGTYDLDMLDGESGVSLLALPQTLLAEGTTTDIVLVGQLADASLAALVETVGVEIAQPVGQLGQLISGSCAEPGDAIADLGVVSPGAGDVVGAVSSLPIAQGFGLASVSFATLVGAPSAVIVVKSDEGKGDIVACGNIGGQLTETGSLVVALQLPGTNAVAGIAVLAPGIDDPETTGVSVFLTGTVAESGQSATPIPVNG